MIERMKKLINAVTFQHIIVFVLKICYDYTNIGKIQDMAFMEACFLKFMTACFPQLFNNPL